MNLPHFSVLSILMFGRESKLQKEEGKVGEQEREGAP